MFSIKEPPQEKSLQIHNKAMYHISCLLLFLYSIFLFALNFIRIFDNAFWGDEGFSILLAKMTIPEMIQITAADVHPPLYYLFIQLLYHIGGNSGIAYHLSALLPYMIMIIITCTIVRKYYGLIPAYVLVTMSSIMKSAVVYNVEARMYSLAAMFVLIAFISLYKITVNNNLINWICFCLASLGAAYTHYYALISVAFFYAILLLLSIKRKSMFKRTICLYIITILAYLPWLSILIKSFGRTADSWWLQKIPTIKDSLLFIFDYQWIYILFFLSVFVFLLYKCKILKLSKKSTDPDNITHNAPLFHQVSISNDMIWVFTGLLSIFGTLCVGLILSYMVRPFFIVRYLFPVTPVAYLIFGYCISKMNLKKIWAFVLISLILVCNLPAYENKLQKDKALNISTTQFLQNVIPSKEALLCTNNVHLGWSLLPYYYPENNYIYFDDPLQSLDQGYDDIYLFWTKKLDSTEKDAIKKRGYFVTKIYKGRFANGIKYHIYSISKIK